MSPADDGGFVFPGREAGEAHDYWRRINRSIGGARTVSAIVVSYFTGPRLRDCLHVLRADNDIDEIIVVNNGNPAEDTQWLESFCARTADASLVTPNRNLGFAAGCNLGAQRARGDRFLFINPDALLRPGSVAALEAASVGLSEPWIVGGRIYFEDGREQRGGRRATLTLWSAFVSYFGLSRLERFHSSFRDVHRENDPLPDGPVSMPAVSGAMMYMSRRGFERLRGFDEAYFLHVEDIDVCRRAREAWGGDVVFTPAAGALHYGSTSKVSSAVVDGAKARGLSIYFKKF
ncbi:MAG: glycosyltransferase family 2 protein, partial [Pseudomonadota bacterium]